MIQVYELISAKFANFWTNIATRYATEEKVIFGLMNEPHDLDIVLWASTVQAAVNAIRAAGATSQSIALPGTLYTHPEKWYDGTNDPLIVSFHKSLQIFLADEIGRN